MRLMHSNLSHDEHEQLKSFAEWTLNVGNGSSQGYSFLGGSEPDWIEIPEEFSNAPPEGGGHSTAVDVQQGTSTRQSKLLNLN